MTVISIHALREEGDVPGQHTGNSRTEFLSTPSARRATWSGRGRSFSSYISIHALREEGDKRIWSRRAESRKFLSTPSARRATTSPSPASLQICYFYPRPPRGGRRLPG